MHHPVSTHNTPAVREPLQAGSTATAELAVAEKHLASAFAEHGDEAYPSVLSTPSLVALVERACAAVLQPLLKAGEMSVGVRVNLLHKLPTALGESVKATAKFLQQDGRLFLFEVSAADCGGVIASGEHARAIVKSDSIEQGALQRAAGRRALP